MLVTEILVLMSLYMLFIYCLVYHLLEAYPSVFEDVYDFAPGVGGIFSLASPLGKCESSTFILSIHFAHVKKLVKTTTYQPTNDVWFLILLVWQYLQF
jgi:DHA1 family multidrug resistance protein-like MFS transporter